MLLLYIATFIRDANINVHALICLRFHVGLPLACFFSDVVPTAADDC